MLSRNIKALFYTIAGPVMTVNGKIYKTFRAKEVATDEPLKIHLGPGQLKYMPGWVNVNEPNPGAPQTLVLEAIKPQLFCNSSNF